MKKVVIGGACLVALAAFTVIGSAAVVIQSAERGARILDSFFDEFDDI